MREAEGVIKALSELVEVTHNYQRRVEVTLKGGWFKRDIHVVIDPCDEQAAQRRELEAYAAGTRDVKPNSDSETAVMRSVGPGPGKDHLT